MLLSRSRQKVAEAGELTCIIGNSMGEINALLEAKMITFPEAWNLVVHRANLMEDALGGKGSELTSGHDVRETTPGATPLRRQGNYP